MTDSADSAAARGPPAASAAPSIPDPPIRTLRVELLSCNSTRYVPCIPNAREPTPFETEFFKGVAMIIIRTKPIDEHFYNFFHGRKRLFEVQVQGKFKREPAGEVFVGAEGSVKLELGMLTRGISRVVLQFINTMVGDLHYSFGDVQDNPLHELPHVVSPMFPTFDKIVVTPPGETPPQIGVPYPEDPEYRKKRLKFRTIKEAQVDLNSTYSFSVNTSNLDLLTWTIVGIPMVKPMDMRTYSGSGSVHLIGYEIPRTVQAKHPGAHPNKLLNYVFCMKLTPINPEEQPLMELPLLSSEDEQEVPEDDTAGHDEPEGEPEELERGAEDAASSSEDDAKDSDDDHAGERRKYTELLLGRKKAQASSGGGVSGWLRNKFARKTKAPAERSLQIVDGSAGELLDAAEEFTLVDFESEATGDLAHCPAVIELNEHKRDGRRRFYYLLPVSAVLGHAAKPDSVDCESPHFRVRTYSEIGKKLPLHSIRKTNKNGRLSTNEKRRRQVVRSMSDLCSENLSRLGALLNPVSDADVHLLGGNAEVEAEATKDGATRSWRGAVALALSRRHWSEQWMVLTRDQVVLTRTRDSKRVVVALPLAEILSVRAVPLELCPIKWLGFLEVETHSRVFTLMVRSDMQVNGWLEAFVTAGVLPSRMRSTSPPLVRAKEVLGEEVFIARPACWKTDKKRVYNYRRIAFGRRVHASEDESAQSTLSPNALVEETLRAAFALSQSSGSQQWLRFWDQIAQLQCVCLIGLSDTQKAAFFLNLYHVMILHGCLMFGPPPAWNHWNAFFNNISYIVGYELVSIAEVEHCILRAAMTKSFLFTAVAMAAPPQTVLPGLAVLRRDFRLHFAVNCGSLSLLPSVPVYTPALLDRQLDDVTRKTLELCLEIDAAKKTVTIPRLPLQDYSSWRPDVAAAAKLPPSVGAADCLRALSSYASKTQKSALASLLSDPQHIIVRFRNLNFKCRALQPMESPGSCPGSS